MLSSDCLIDSLATGTERPCSGPLIALPAILPTAKESTTFFKSLPPSTSFPEAIGGTKVSMTAWEASVVPSTRPPLTPPFTVSLIILFFAISSALLTASSTSSLERLVFLVKYLIVKSLPNLPLSPFTTWARPKRSKEPIAAPAPKEIFSASSLETPFLINSS